jgi:L-rhamnose isomerase
MLSPNAMLKDLQDQNKLSELMIAQEIVKTLPFGDIWNEYCVRNNAPLDEDLFAKISAYENEVLAKRV